MVYIALILLGLCFGSFVNALVWRLYQQGNGGEGEEQGPESDKKDKKSGKKARHAVAYPPALTPPPASELSILKGRSMCVDCRHTLAAKDLIPVLSWVSLRGKCRYCRKAISWQYPLVELLTAGLFVASYVFWPLPLSGSGLLGLSVSNGLAFGFWLIFLVGFMALAVYDLRWFLLPNKIVYPLLVLAAGQALARAALDGDVAILTTAIWGLAIGGGIFYLLFQVSRGTWIGGGDVKLGFLLGLIVGGPVNSLLLLFLASLLGCLVTVPLLLSGRATRKSHIPFGPFLLLAAIIVQLFGAAILAWYQHQFLLM